MRIIDQHHLRRAMHSSGMPVASWLVMCMCVLAACITPIAAQTRGTCSLKMGRGVIHELAEGEEKTRSGDDEGGQQHRLDRVARPLENVQSTSGLGPRARCGTRRRNSKVLDVLVVLPQIRQAQRACGAREEQGMLSG